MVLIGYIIGFSAREARAMRALWNPFFFDFLICLKFLAVCIQISGLILGVCMCLFNLRFIC